MAENLIDAAKSMVPLIQSSLDRIDSERQLPSELASAMAQKHLFGLYVPKELGGPETDPITAFRVVEEIAQADGSAGWCVFNGTAVSSAVARLSPRAATELFGDPPLVLGSGSARAGGTANGASIPSRARMISRDRSESAVRTTTTDMTTASSCTWPAGALSAALSCSLVSNECPAG